MGNHIEQNFRILHLTCHGMKEEIGSKESWFMQVRLVMFAQKNLPHVSIG